MLTTQRHQNAGCNTRLPQLQWRNSIPVPLELIQELPTLARRPPLADYTIDVERMDSSVTSRVRENAIVDQVVLNKINRQKGREIVRVYPVSYTHLTLPTIYSV